MSTFEPKILIIPPLDLVYKTSTLWMYALRLGIQTDADFPLNVS